MWVSYVKHECTVQSVSFFTNFFHEWINDIAFIVLGRCNGLSSRRGFAPSFHRLWCRALEAATAIRWRENRLLEGVSGSIPSSLGVRKPKRISRGSQIRVRASLQLESYDTFSIVGDAPSEVLVISNKKYY